MMIISNCVVVDGLWNTSFVFHNTQDGSAEEKGDSVNPDNTTEAGGVGEGTTEVSDAKIATDTETEEPLEKPPLATDMPQLTDEGVGEQEKTTKTQPEAEPEESDGDGKVTPGTSKSVENAFEGSEEYQVQAKDVEPVSNALDWGYNTMHLQVSSRKSNDNTCNFLYISTVYQYQCQEEVRILVH